MLVHFYYLKEYFPSLLTGLRFGFSFFHFLLSFLNDECEISRITLLRNKVQHTGPGEIVRGILKVSRPKLKDMLAPPEIGAALVPRARTRTFWAICSAISALSSDSCNSFCAFRYLAKLIAANSSYKSLFVTL